MDPMGFERSVGSTRKSCKSCSLPELFEGCTKSFSTTGKLGGIMLGTRFIHPSRGFKEIAELMRLPMVPAGPLANQVTNCNLYRDGTLGSMPRYVL